MRRMKNIKWLSGVFIVALGLLALSACSEDDDKVKLSFPDKQPIDCAVGEEKTLTFDVEHSWTLSSSRLWCKFKDGEEQVSSLTGGPGQQTITVTVTEDVWGFEDAIAEISLGMQGQTQVIAVVNRASKAYQMDAYYLDDNNNKVSYDNENPVVISYYSDNSTLVNVTANFDWKVKDCPEWIMVEEKDLLGEAGKIMEWELTFKTTENISKINEQEGNLEFVDANGALRLTVPVKYNGMPEDEIEFVRPQRDWWNWFFSVDAMKFWQSSGMEPEGGFTKYDAPMSITAVTRSGFEIVRMEIDPEYGYTPKEDYYPGLDWFNAKNELDKISLTVDLNRGTERKGCVMAIPSKVFEALPGGVEDLISEDWFSIKDEYTKYIAVEFEQEGAEVTSRGFDIEDDAGGSLTGLLMDMTSQESSESLIAQYGTDNVFMLTLDAANSYSTLTVTPKGYPNMQCDFEQAGSIWEGVSIDANWQNGIFIMDISASEKGEMRILFKNGGDTYGVLLMTQYYN